MGYRTDLWEIAAMRAGVVVVREAEEAGVPAVEVRKLAARGALIGYGQGVYRHRDIPATERTQPTLAVALAGRGAFLHRESVFVLHGIGQFNPPKIQVATSHRVRRSLPDWIELSFRGDVPESDLTDGDGVRMTTLERALADTADRIPQDRWNDLVERAIRRDLLDAGAVRLQGGSGE